MMRLSQPDVPCPDKLTIVNMLKYHNRFMSAFRQNEGMCTRRMRYPINVKTKMVRMCMYYIIAIVNLYVNTTLAIPAITNIC